MQKKFRLLKNRDFQSIIHGKKQLLTKYLILYYKPNNLQHIRIGLSVSKKFGNAVLRNATRRKIRAALCDINIKDLKFDMILIARQEFVKSVFDKQQKTIKEIFERFINEKTKK